MIMILFFDVEIVKRWKMLSVGYNEYNEGYENCDCCLEYVKETNDCYIFKCLVCWKSEK